MSKFKQVERLYPGAKIIQIMQYFIPGEGWKDLTGWHVFHESEVETFLRRIQNSGGTEVNIRVQEDNEYHEPDYKISELLN
jgi:hypothetical protein